MNIFKIGQKVRINTIAMEKIQGMEGTLTKFWKSTEEFTVEFNTQLPGGYEGQTSLIMPTYQMIAL